MLETVEKYEITEEIGHGGMATVYKAQDTRLERPVALKVMHPHLQGAREARQRFAREALTVARLRHPSILEIYDYSGEDSEVSYIATELLTGPTLKVFAEVHPEIPPEIAACIVIQVARALAAAHAEGVVHRDVKPENVMLHESRCVKLTDFGIAQLVDVQGMTTTGQVLGSPMHMAPEQIEGKECGPRTDLFSVGTVLYLLATGELPFTGQNPHQVLKRIMEGRFTDPQQVRPAIGGRLSGIIRRLLETDPARRYQNAGDLDRDLCEFVAELGIDSPDETLAEYLSDPDGFSERFRARSIERLIELGERAQQRGSVPSALDYYNRVLALDEGNERVLAAVQRIGQRSQVRRFALVGVAAAVVIGLGVGGYFALRPEPGPMIAAVGPAPDTVTPPPPSAEPVRSEPPQATPAKPPKPKVEAPSPSKKIPRKPRPRPIGNGPRLVSFKPTPANVSIGVNGAAPRAFGPSFRHVELEPGSHRFKFVGGHDCCIDEEITVDIPPGEGTFTVAKQLRFRPAGLYVVSDTHANVSIDDGKIAGRTRNVIQVPGLRDMTETHRVRVSAEGYEDYVQQVRLKAGQVVTVKVAMQKKATEGS
ncbi:MAG: protein kinase [Myxococcales bacterium]|nr:protein kinase [Myxococcales bacterium]